MNDFSEETTAHGGGRGFTAGAVLGLCFLTAAAAALLLGRGGAGFAMNAAAGAALALGLLAGTELAGAAASRRGAGAVMPVSILGSLARMAAVAAALIWAGTRTWFEPIPFVAAFGVLYFAIGVALVVRQGAARWTHRSVR